MLTMATNTWGFEYMLYGGIPLVVLREGANDKAVAALQNLFNEIYIRDITKRNRVKILGAGGLVEYPLICDWLID